ncbi:UDP-glycosyltransferase 74E2-like [Pistacia vera]|uniref:UDP-glycosyltransferase 74E2-like n=1 Tax=Pistacia vera TaxID=55513 RepID=UPI001263A507|nr:UDP-glycosyltransferase 74E2-like [Pistacia vera]
MEISEQNVKGEAHILCYSFAIQGHLNPILQFCKRLASKGLKVTLVSTISASSKLIKTQSCSSIDVELLDVELRDTPNNSKEGERDESQHYFEHYKTIVAPSLAAFIENQMSSNYPPKFLVYDSIIPWALDITKRFGIDGAPFFTQSWSCNTIYYQFYREKSKVNAFEDQAMVLVPSLPPLKINELPSFLNGSGTYPSIIDLCLNQFSNIEEVNWLFFSSFDKLEEGAITWMATQLPVKAIGPTIPSKYLDNRLKNDKDYGLNLFKPNTETCLKWLDSKQPASVIYVSFGSLAALEKNQMEEIAWGLKNSNIFFLWVVRESECEKLPENFSEETSEKGLVVSWCCQLEVLAHESVGCFMTHCGWNSTLEAISVGVPIVAMPQWADQPTNAKFIEDVWGVGMRARGNGEGIVKREEIEVCVREVMEGERGKEIKRNSKKWKDLAKEAVDEGGSTDKNIQEFVAKVLYM